MPVFYSLLFLVMGFLTAASDSGGDLTGPAIALLFVLPPLVGSGLPLFRSSSPGIPLAVLKWMLLVALPAVPLLAAAHFSRPMGESVLVALAALVFVMFAWFPQVAVVLVYFHLRRPGRVVLSRRFSLRTFFVGFTLLSIALAGVGLYVKSSYGMQYDLERITHFEPDWLFRMETSVSDRRDLEQKISQQLHDRIVSTLVARNYREFPLPMDLARRRYVREESEYQWTCYLCYMPDNEQVYVLMKTLDGKLISVESGTAQVGWHNSHLGPAKPATQVEHKIVVDFLHALSSVWRHTIRSPNLLADADAYIQEAKIADSGRVNQND